MVVARSSSHYRFAGTAWLPSLVLAAGLAVVAAADDNQPERTVAEARVEGNVALAAETVLHYLGLGRGDRLDEEALDRGLRELWETGLVEWVEVEAVPHDGEVSVVVRIEERPRLVALEFRGMDSLGTRELELRRQKAGIEVAQGAPLAMAEVQRLRRLIEELYRERGFRFVEVRRAVEEVSFGEVRVTLEVDEGERLPIGRVEFEGSYAFDEARLRRAMRSTLGGGFLSRLFARARHSRTALREDLERIQELYRRSGYKDAEVGEPRIEIEEGDGGRRLAITIPVCEGRRWKLGEISMAGNRALSDQRLLSALESPRGPWLSSRSIDAWTETVQSLYQNRGYVRVRVEAAIRERPGGVAEVLFEIDEGELYRVGRVEIEGNTRTRDRVLRRLLRVQEGEVLNQGALQRSLAEIDRLPYFDLDAEEPVKLRVDEAEHTVDLRLQGREADRTQVQVSGGWGRLDEFSGRLGIQTSDLLGRGESLGLRLEGGGVEEGFNLFFEIPWLLGRRQRLGVDLLSQEQRITGAEGQVSVADEKGVRVSWARSPGAAGSWGLTYEYKDVEEGLAGAVQEPLETFASSSLQAAYLRDRRDNPRDPAAGSRLRVSLELAGSILGGERSLVRPEVRFSYYRPVVGYPLRTLFALHTAAGWIEPYDGYRVTPLEGFFLGGPGSVRGFRPGSIWVRGEDDELLLREGLAVGGTRFFQLNLDFQLVVRDEVRFVVFADAGGVWGEEESLDLSDLRTSAGAELRFGLRGIGTPLRLIYAVNLDPLPGDQFEEIRLAFGTTF